MTHTQITQNKIIEIIKILRKEKGWTQHYMAEELGITQSSYGKIERGDVDITISKVFKILKAINQEPSEFFGMVAEGSPGIFTYDDALSYQLEEKKSLLDLREAEITYLKKQLEINAKQLEIKDKRITDLQAELKITDDLLEESGGNK